MFRSSPEGKSKIKMDSSFRWNDGRVNDKVNAGSSRRYTNAANALSLAPVSAFSR